MNFRELVDSVGDDGLAYISSKDYGIDSVQHLEALRQVCHFQDGIMNSEQFWYPSEVVELCSNRLVKGREKEFSLCHCLIAKAISAGHCAVRTVGGQLSGHSTDYENLPHELRKLVMECLNDAAT